MGLGFRVWGLYMVSGLGLIGFRVKDLGFIGFRAWGL